MQQATTSLPASHPVRSLQGLAKQIALPHEYAPLRFPSFPALERTALMGFSYPASLQLPASTDVRVLVFRQAAYPVWADIATTGMAYSCSWKSTVTPSLSATQTIVYEFNTGPYDAFTGNRTATNSSIGVSGGYGEKYPILGADSTCGPVPFVFVPKNFNAQCIVNASSGTFAGPATISINWETWSSPGEVNEAVLTGSISVSAGNTGSSDIFSADTDGGRWVRPSLVTNAMSVGAPSSLVVSLVVYSGTSTYTTSTSTYGNLAITGAAKTGTIPLCYPIEFSNSPMPWYSCRTTATSFLATNVTQVLNKGGTVLAGRLSPAVYNAFRVKDTVLSGLHPAEKAYLPLETGVYTFVPPSTDLQNFWDYSSTSAINSSYTSNMSGSTPFFRLDNDSLYHALTLTASGVAESMACTIDWHIEFRTSSALFQIGLSTMTLETLHQAQIALAEAGYFFENPTHSKILNRVVAAVKKHGPAVASALPLPPSVKMAAKLGQMVISGRPRKSPPTTTLARSANPPAGKKKNGPKQAKRAPKRR